MSFCVFQNHSDITLCTPLPLVEVTPLESEKALIVDESSDLQSHWMHLWKMKMVS